MSDELETVFVCHRCKAEWWITGYDRSVTVSSRGKVLQHLSAPPTWVEVSRPWHVHGRVLLRFVRGRAQIPEAYLTDREAT